MTVGCSCVRPTNPWYFVYWLSIPLLLGSAAALTLRARFLLATALFAGSLAVSGAAILVYASVADLIDGEGVALGKLALAFLVAVAVAAFAIVRAVARRFGSTSTAT